MYHIGLQTLRAKIRGFHVAGSTIASHISKAKSDRKNRLWEMKRQLGDAARYHLIAYGILRSVPYAQIEKCAENNRPSPQRVLDILTAHNSWEAGVQFMRYDIALVERLLTPSASVSDAAKRASNRHSTVTPTAPTMALEKAA